MKLFCIGDSITCGYGVSPSQRWTRLTSDMTGTELVNLGINGDTTGGMLARLTELRRHDDLSGCIVMISGGGNDIFFSGTDAAARANIAAMTQQVLSCGALPLVGIPAPICPGHCSASWKTLVDFEAAAVAVCELREWLIKYCAAFGIESFDFAEALSDENGIISESLFFDGIHPTVEGHTLVAQALACKLLELEEKFNG